MDDNEKGRAQAEALRSTATSSTDRARFWAGLNTFLAAQAQHEHEQEEDEATDSDPTS